MTCGYRSKLRTFQYVGSRAPDRSAANPRNSSKSRTAYSRVLIMSEMDLKNKVVLLTGGASGIGFGYGKELLRNGIQNLAILDLVTSCGKESAEKLNAEFGDGRVIFIPCDVSNAKEFEAAFEKTIKTFGGLDIVINNAGVLNGSNWELMININYTAVVRGSLLGLKHMGKDRGGKGGVIVNIASLYGLDPVAYFPIYDGTKHAVVGFSRSLGLPYHFNKTGVRVLTLCPGITETPLVATAGKHVLDIIEPEIAVAAVANEYQIQDPKNVAQAMVDIIRSAKPGTVWLSEASDQVREVVMPDRFTMTAQAKDKQ